MGLDIAPPVAPNKKKKKSFFSRIHDALTKPVVSSKKSDAQITQELGLNKDFSKKASVQDHLKTLEDQANADAHEQASAYDQEQGHNETPSQGSNPSSVEDFSKEPSPIDSSSSTLKSPLSNSSSDSSVDSSPISTSKEPVPNDSATSAGDSNATQVPVDLLSDSDSEASIKTSSSDAESNGGSFDDFNSWADESEPESVGSNWANSDESETVSSSSSSSSSPKEQSVTSDSSTPWTQDVEPTTNSSESKFSSSWLDDPLETSSTKKPSSEFTQEVPATNSSATPVAKTDTPVTDAVGDDFAATDNLTADNLTTDNVAVDNNTTSDNNTDEDVDDKNNESSLLSEDSKPSSVEDFSKEPLPVIDATQENKPEEKVQEGTEKKESSDDSQDNFQEEPIESVQLDTPELQKFTHAMSSPVIDTNLSEVDSTPSSKQPSSAPVQAASASTQQSIQQPEALKQAQATLEELGPNFITNYSKDKLDSPTVTSIESDLTLVEQEKQDAHKAMYDAKKDLAHAQTIQERDALRKELSIYKDKLTALQTQEQRLLAHLNRLETNTSQLFSLKNQLDDQTRQMQTNIQDLESQKSQVIANLSQQQSLMQQKKAEFDDMMNKQSQTLNLLQDQEKQLRTDVTNEQQKVTELTQNEQLLEQQQKRILEEKDTISKDLFSREQQAILKIKQAQKEQQLLAQKEEELNQIRAQIDQQGFHVYLQSKLNEIQPGSHINSTAIPEYPQITGSIADIISGCQEAIDQEDFDQARNLYMEAREQFLQNQVPEEHKGYVHNLIRSLYNDITLKSLMR
jgi:hypothetical protein